MLTIVFIPFYEAGLWGISVTSEGHLCEYKTKLGYINARTMAYGQGWLGGVAA